MVDTYIHTYILEGHEPVEEKDLLKWAVWFEKADRHVARTELPDGLLVSTVFLSIDHNFGPTGEPLLFETMVFDKRSERIGNDLYMERYQTWDKAVAGHERVVKMSKIKMVRETT